jgi:hypothetical protein
MYYHPMLGQIQPPQGGILAQPPNPQIGMANSMPQGMPPQIPEQIAHTPIDRSVPWHVRALSMLEQNPRAMQLLMGIGQGQGQQQQQAPPMPQMMQAPGVGQWTPPHPVLGG